MVNVSVRTGLRIEGLSLHERRDALFADAKACAAAAPAAMVVMGERLGRAARDKKMVTLSELGRGLVVVRPSDQRAIVVDALGGQLAPDQGEILDQIALHLAHLAWMYCTELASWSSAEILCNALVLGPKNQPTPGFWTMARFSGRSPGSLASQTQKDAFWAREVNRVHEWFAQLQRQHPFEALASS